MIPTWLDLGSVGLVVLAAAAYLWRRTRRRKIASCGLAGVDCACGDNSRTAPDTRARVIPLLDLPRRGR